MRQLSPKAQTLLHALTKYADDPVPPPQGALDWADRLRAMVADRVPAAMPLVEKAMEARPTRYQAPLDWATPAIGKVTQDVNRLREQGYGAYVSPEWVEEAKREWDTTKGIAGKEDPTWQSRVLGLAEKATPHIPMSDEQRAMLEHRGRQTGRAYQRYLSPLDKLFVPNKEDITGYLRNTLPGGPGAEGAHQTERLLGAVQGIPQTQALERGFAEGQKDYPVDDFSKRVGKRARSQFYGHSGSPILTAYRWGQLPLAAVGYGEKRMQPLVRAGERLSRGEPLLPESEIGRLVKEQWGDLPPEIQTEIQNKITHAGAKYGGRALEAASPYLAGRAVEEAAVLAPNIAYKTVGKNIAGNAKAVGTAASEVGSILAKIPKVGPAVAPVVRGATRALGKGARILGKGLGYAAKASGPLAEIGLMGEDLWRMHRDPEYWNAFAANKPSGQQGTMADQFEAAFNNPVGAPYQAGKETGRMLFTGKGRQEIVDSAAPLWEDAKNYGRAPPGWERTFAGREVTNRSMPRPNEIDDWGGREKREYTQNYAFEQAMKQQRKARGVPEPEIWTNPATRRSSGAEADSYVSPQAGGPWSSLAPKAKAGVTPPPAIDYSESDEDNPVQGSTTSSPWGYNLGKK